MIRTSDLRVPLAMAGAFLVGLGLVHMVPFPDGNPLLAMVRVARPELFAVFKYTYLSLCFSTPYIVLSVLLSAAYIFLPGKAETSLPELPLYPAASDRKDLFVIVGELHHAKRIGPARNPRWLAVPEPGLFTGIAVIGAVGTGKTSACMYPFTEQLLAYRAGDPESRIGGLILEVKGDFCQKVRGILEKYGRDGDYLEVSLDGQYRYNPLHNDLDASALAYGIASLLNNLYGKGREPFWQQAYTNLVKFIILLHKVLYDYVTLFDVYECAINPDLVEQRIATAEALFEQRSISIEIDPFLADKALEKFPFEPDKKTGRMQAPYSEQLAAHLRESGTPHDVRNDRSASSATTDLESNRKREEFEAVKRWFFQDWTRIEPRLRTSIVEGISVFLSLFDDPTVKYVFCPPKEVYDPVANSKGEYGQPVPPFRELIEKGCVCALNFPVATNPSLAKIIGTLMKHDFQRAVLTRITEIESDRNRHWREVLFVCDEYHSFATTGENDPSGDEKFFALSRQARCIPIVATQSISSLRSTLPGESWRTLLQTFRTKIFLALSDDFSAKTASELCGKEEQLKLSYTLSENGQDAGISVFTGRASAHRATLSASKSYNVARDLTFEPKVFAELRNGQAIVLAYDGFNPHPPTFCYLKPYYLDQNRSYFEQEASRL
jgi:hypothetical protein